MRRSRTDSAPAGILAQAFRESRFVFDPMAVAIDHRMIQAATYRIGGLMRMSCHWQSSCFDW
jgi:hypothetical protein